MTGFGYNVSGFGSFPSRGGGGLYAFTAATFTPGGKTGSSGPSLAQARSGLTGTDVSTWKNDTQYFNTSSGIMVWTVPADGVYSIDCYGAGGAFCTRENANGGTGARIKGSFTLTSGQLINLVVGQAGRSQTNGWGGGGGGGGTFAWNPLSPSNPLIAAGGGGGGGRSSIGQQNAYTGTSGGQGSNGGSVGGTNGNPGAGNSCGGGGGQGWNGGVSRHCGGNFTWPTLRSNPTGFSSGGHSTNMGGFGGGAGSYGGSGGAGGYSGGGSGGWSYAGFGGGGGSYNGGTSQTAQTNQTPSATAGKIIITRI